MNITNQSKISDIISSNKEAIEALISVSSSFNRLKNPILRKVIASRVTLSEAAKMGNTTVEAIVKALAPLGFTYSKTDEPVDTQESVQPAWLTNASSVVQLDVRPIIENGTDPIKVILGEFKKINAGGVLEVINTFVPTPLINLLKQNLAEDSHVESVNPSEHHTYFLKAKRGKEKLPPPETNMLMENATSFDELLSSFLAQELVEIDVRELEMPLPMQTILNALQELPEGKALYVHHKRMPVHLLEALADEPYQIHIHEVEEGNLKMLIYKVL